MATHAIRDDEGRVTTILTLADIYQYKGFIFEVHRSFGPCKLKKDREPAAAMGRQFWKVWGEWNKLSKEQKAKTQIAC